MKATPFANALRRAEGTIASRTGGRRAWDSLVLKETALSAMAGETPSLGSCSPEEYDSMHEACSIIRERTTAEHAGRAGQI